MIKKSKNGLIRPHTSKIQALARLLDVAVIGITLWAILNFAHVEWDLKHNWWLTISIVSFFLFAEFNDLYRVIRGAPIKGVVFNILLTWFCVVVVLILVDQFYLMIDPVYQTLFLIWLCAVPVEMLSWHFIVDGFLHFFRKKGGNSRRVAIVGTGDIGLELQEIFVNEEWMGLSFSGFYDDRFKEREGAKKITLQGRIATLIKDAKEGVIDIVYIVLPLKAERRIKEIISELADTTVSVYYVPDFFGFDLLRSQWGSVGNIPVVSIYDSPFYGIDGVFKRVFDIIFSLFILMIIAIPMVIIAIAVITTSNGPAIFKQKRYGLKGEEILVWKFRSMTVQENDGKVEQAKKNDPRVTKLGAFLRKTSLDELPQFINVLQGRMSVVGPRPHAVVHNELYRTKIQGYMLRHKVKPGITGLAQVSGFRGETDTLDKMEGRIKYDLDYISRWSLLLDMKIVALTVFKGFLGKQAY